MGVIFTESFGWSNASSDYFTYKGYSVAGGANTGLILSNAASGSISPPWTGAWYATWQGQFAQPVANTPTRLIVGTRFASDAASLSSGFVIDTLRAGFANNLLVQFDGFSTWTTAQRGTSLGSFTFAPVPYTWYYLEIDFNEGGNLIIRINGVTKLTTANTESAPILNLNWSLFGSGRVWVADLYVVQPSASPNSSFLGDVHVECRRPSGPGVLTQWTPSGGGTPNWQEVDDAPAPDGDTSYVSTNADTARDYYAQPSINEASPTNVYAMGSWIFAKTTSAGQGGVKASLSSSGTQQDGTLFVPSNSLYQGVGLYADVDPNTGVAWTAAGANAAQPGQLLTGLPI